jgi:hypothetical protein
VVGSLMGDRSQEVAGELFFLLFIFIFFFTLLFDMMTDPCWAICRERPLRRRPASRKDERRHLDGPLTISSRAFLWIECPNVGIYVRIT